MRVCGEHRGGAVAAAHPTDADSTALAEGLLDVLLGMHRLMRAQPPHDSDAAPPGQGGRDRPEFAEKGGQFRLLRVLYKRGQLTMQEIAAALDVAPPTVTGVVKRLLEQGYVERLRDDADWRTVSVALTDEGRGVIRRHHRERAVALERRIELLSEQERSTLRDALPALVHLVLLTQGPEKKAAVGPASRSRDAATPEERA